MVEELAWQMGRPTRYGGEFGGVNDRTDYMSDIAADDPGARMMVEDSDKFRRYIAREPVGVVFIIAPWNYPYLTTINTLVPALIAGQHGGPEARQPDPAGRRTAGRGVPRGGRARGRVPERRPGPCHAPNA